MPSLLLVLALDASAATLDVGAGYPYATVADAVAAADEGDVVQIHPGTYTEAIVFDEAELTLIGVGDASAIVLQAGSDDVLTVGDDSVVLVQNLVLDGQDLANLGFVEGDGSLTLDGVTVRNGAGDKGGCFHVHGTASLELLQSVVEGCVATSNGGAIYLHNDAKLAVDTTRFQDNRGDKGGALSCENDTVCVVQRSAFVDNVATGNGGAVELATNLPALIAESLFATNTSEADGGAVHIESLVDIEDNVFCENHADGDGGAVTIQVQSDVVSNHFLGNTSSGLGAAMATSDRTVFINNLVAGNVGTGAAVSGGGLLTLSYGWFVDNQATDEDATSQTGSTYGRDPELERYEPGNCTGSAFRLAAGSPLLDGGDPDPTFDDPDGSVGDIGAYDPDFSGLFGVDSDGDGVPDADDCAPSDPGVRPGGTEIAGDGIDQDCSGSDDCYIDVDGDGYGGLLAPATTADCSGPDETVDGGDCDEDRVDVNPGADEACDAFDVDEDCDGLADDADGDATGQVPLYIDGDLDGYGDPAGLAADPACDAPVGFSLSDDDCDDGNAAVNPGASEVCDPLDVDEDCNGLADDDDPAPQGTTLQIVDLDGDSYAPADLGLACDAAIDVLVGVDCDDSRADVSPAGQEVCDPDDADEDCDGFTDDDDDDVQGQTPQFPDGDGDGYGEAGASGSGAFCDPDPGFSLTDDDCNDAAAAVNPGAQEVCDPDDVDEDCDGLADDADTDALGATLQVADLDGDGYAGPDEVFVCDAGDEPPGDCDDGDTDISPDAVEIPGDGIDQNCSGADLVESWAGGGGCGCTTEGTGWSLWGLARRR